MLAMIIGGNTFGLIGILLGIPIFSVIYKVFKEFVDKRLNYKNINIV